jgi:hypothetical protein
MLEKNCLSIQVVRLPVSVDVHLNSLQNKKLEVRLEENTLASTFCKSHAYRITKSAFFILLLRLIDFV